MFTCNPDGCWQLCLVPPGHVDALLPHWVRGLSTPNGLGMAGLYLEKEDVFPLPKRLCQRLLSTTE